MDFFVYYNLLVLHEILSMNYFIKNGCDYSLNFITLGDRMKRQESATRQVLPCRTYTVVRLDGKSFHNYTRGLQKPFDLQLINDMQLTAKALAEQVSGCHMAYTQSDEISLILSDLSGPDTQAYFDGQVQKIVSVTASIATANFNLLRIGPDTHRGRKGTLPVFDSRAFTLPSLEEVYDYLSWRQIDASRNSLQMVAQAFYSQKELHSKKRADLHEMISAKGINYNDYHSHAKRGSFIIKETYEGEGFNRKTKEVVQVLRSRWNVLEETPLIISEDGKAWLKNILK